MPRGRADSMAPLCRLRAEAQGGVGGRAGCAAPANGPAPLQAAPRAACACSRCPTAGHNPSHRECMYVHYSAVPTIKSRPMDKHNRNWSSVAHTPMCPCQSANHTQLRWGADEQGALRRATGGKLSVNAALPRRFPCSLDPSPSSSSGASTGAGGAASRELGEPPSACF